ncbi:2-hydroxychromene-2-carboxylate isomerase [Amaricoccus macauensis]|uniref:2-hydroxychromene-2-carboxylate isomerase n=1 Tax=Amaricoccus macauensis TaxID=57001 RepID=UPI003C7AC6D4
MTQIDYYYFPISPYVYLAGLRLEEIAGKHGASINYKPVELMRIYAEMGTEPLPKRHDSRKIYRLKDIARQARFLDMPLNPEPAHFPTNPVPACTALIAAAHDGSGDVGKLAHLLSRATWAEERDLADEAVVRDCLSQAGFDPELASKGMLSGVEELQRNTDEAIRRGVFGAPFYGVGEELFWGQDRLPHLDAHLDELAAR